MIKLDFSDKMIIYLPIFTVGPDLSLGRTMFKAWDHIKNW